MTTPEAGPPQMPPHRHIPPRRRRLRHFLLQLLPVTAGILIALLIDGLVELQRQRALVNEARAAIAAEISANALELEGRLPTFTTMQGEIAAISRLVNDILNRGRTDIESFGYKLDLPALSRASWESAERTGALAYMDYEEVRRYSELYAMQELVEASQRGLLARLPQLGVIKQAMDSGDPEGYVQDFQVIRKDVAELEDALLIYIDLADLLAMAYEEF